MSKQEHHRFLHCPISDCTYYGEDLLRHLKAKKHREDVDPLEANAIAQMVSKGKETKGPNRLLIRWCPVEGCSFLTPYLQNHLRNKHKIRNDTRLDDVMKMSLPYEPYKLPLSAATSVRIESDDDDDDDDDEEEDYPGEGAKAIWYMREDLTSLGARTHTTTQRIREGIQQDDNRMHSMTMPSGTATSSTERESTPSREPSPPVSLPTPHLLTPVSPQTSKPPTILFQIHPIRQPWRLIQPRSPWHQDQFCLRRLYLVFADLVFDADGLQRTLN